MGRAAGGRARGVRSDRARGRAALRRSCLRRGAAGPAAPGDRGRLAGKCRRTRAPGRAGRALGPPCRSRSRRRPPRGRGQRPPRPLLRSRGPAAGRGRGGPLGAPRGGPPRGRSRAPSGRARPLALRPCGAGARGLLGVSRCASAARPRLPASPGAGGRGAPPLAGRPGAAHGRGFRRPPGRRLAVAAAAELPPPLGGTVGPSGAPRRRRPRSVALLGSRSPAAPRGTGGAPLLRRSRTRRGRAPRAGHRGGAAPQRPPASGARIRSRRVGGHRRRPSHGAADLAVAPPGACGAPLPRQRLGSCSLRVPTGRVGEARPRRSLIDSRPVSPKRKRRGRLKPPSPRLGRGYPFVAIVGRPNVGKSTLFNRLVGQRLAITEDTAGTTRDRIAALVETEDGRLFELCDTGGLGGTGDRFDEDVNRQIDLAVDYADLVLFLVDARAGLLGDDERIARRLKKTGKPVLVVANKAETATLEATAGEFYALGFPGEVHTVSAREGTGRSDLLAAIAEHLPAPAEDATATDAEEGVRDLRIAILGRRNAGKSTFVNRILGEERVIVSEQEGTTRDAVDVRVSVGGRDVVLIDTAGLRKRGKADDAIEIISHGRARYALRRCDVALLFLDCLRDIGQVDKQIAAMIRDEHKACVVVANKWDLVDGRMTPEEFADYAARALPNLAFCPLVAASAREGERTREILDTAFELHAQTLVRVGTGELNRALSEALRLRRPKPRKNRIGKIYFGVQVATRPVTLLLFVNDPELFPRTYRRYLEGQMRKLLPWKEVPVKLCFRGRESVRRKGGRLARRLERLAGLAEQPVWLDDRPEQNVRSLGATLDGAEVQAALAEVFETAADEDGRGAHERPPEEEG
ncbi:MAG: ribosome biogenesis GTPase Der [Planctomycetota bacterium]|nr:MAG: ribosome biogenesis GTPase Der [Planctomycetota bacterium]